jgi:hypothetical protein
MSRYLGLLGERFVKFRLGLVGKFIDDVPPEYAVCEFHCRKPRCVSAEWLHCEGRLSLQTSGPRAIARTS